MLNYLIRRLLLLPITLFLIVLVNFVIINLAPGDPVTISEVSEQGVTRKESNSIAFGNDDRYLQFREFYGLTLPILFNTWPYTSYEYVERTLNTLNSEEEKNLNFKKYQDLKISFGDRSRFIMPDLLFIAKDINRNLEIRKLAVSFFVRGGTQQAILGSNLTEEDKEYNKKIAKDNNLLKSLLILPSDNLNEINEKIEKANSWYQQNKDYYEFEPNSLQKIKILFFETRFFKYFKRVLTLDFGTLRNDMNKTVVSEVTKRFKYSLTLSLVPMLITFILCQFLGFTMAYKKNQWQDHLINVLCLIFYAIPIFVAIPYLIQYVAMNNTFPFTNVPIPISGFTSPDAIYELETSRERLFDIFQHIALPIIAVTYGGLAAQSRLSRTAVLEVLNQDYVRTAKAKGLKPFTILYKHVGRNAAITIVTSIAGSLGVVLAGSLIAETLFEINGFGKFFYEAVINRDYNVIMFSTLAGSFLTLLGYLTADIAYTALDPRVSLE